ncbi:hypothetical protein Ocin01_18490 [Orchesella cincta]|uniref:Uncharacterized protein n=1 Tax=Orchesella cincta TaxID=48709 RepID=A0A1D2M5K5_ORCCI|nr:hypothetical protein Ocin01_18490 [Orchesella cincta]
MTSSADLALSGCFLIPLGQKLRVGQKNSTKSRISPPIHNEELLNAFKRSGGKLSQNELASLAKRTDMTRVE